MKHHSEKIPGFDCMLNECTHTPKQREPGSHGRKGEVWFYAIRADDGLTALSFEVATHLYPSSTPYTQQPPLGIDPRAIQFHVAFPFHDIDHTHLGGDGLPFVNEPGPVDGCRALDKNNCTCSYDSSLDAQSFFKAWFHPSRFEQGATFWEELGNIFLTKDADIRSRRFDVSADEGKAKDWLRNPRKVAASIDDQQRWLRRAFRERDAAQAEADRVDERIPPKYKHLIETAERLSLYRDRDEGKREPHIEELLKTHRGGEIPVAERLASLAIWETERIVRQAFSNALHGADCGPNGQLWDSCFARIFARFLEQEPWWQKLGEDQLGDVLAAAVKDALHRLKSNP